MAEVFEGFPECFEAADGFGVEVPLGAPAEAGVLSADAAGVDVDEEFVHEFVDVGVAGSRLGRIVGVPLRRGVRWVEVVQVVLVRIIVGVWAGLVAMSHFDEWLDKQPERMSVEQVAELLGVTGRTINNWLNEGRVPGYRTPGSWFVLREELRDFLRANRNRPSDAPIEDLPDHRRPAD